MGGKIIVIGCPGSGKSTFARELHQKSGIPLYPLDNIYWRKDRSIVEKEIFLSQLRDIMKKEEWILDGNYASTMEERMEKCDSVFFLDIPVNVCLAGIESRKGKKREDIPWVEEETDKAFLESVKRYEKEQRPRVMELLKKYSCKEIHIFHSRKETEEYLQEQKNVHTERKDE